MAGFAHLVVAVDFFTIRADPGSGSHSERFNSLCLTLCNAVATICDIPKEKVQVSVSKRDKLIMGTELSGGAKDRSVAMDLTVCAQQVQAQVLGPELVRVVTDADHFPRIKKSRISLTMTRLESEQVYIGEDEVNEGEGSDSEYYSSD